MSSYAKELLKEYARYHWLACTNTVFTIFVLGEQTG